ncbi:unnamed protein product [Rangifer tarandus platyrhynchus]|uniref:Uncharacterized protein n=1 Tax=Rangifer tarandus platyrhynchus TaxID=3082113 RepID=A0AC59ZVD4_RANTA
MEGLERDVREKGWAVTFFGWTSEDSAKSHIISYTLKLEELAECTVSELWGWSCWGWRSVVGAEGVAEVEPAPERELRLMLRCCWPSRGSGPGAVPALGLKPALSLVVVLEPALDLTLVLRLTLGLCAGLAPEWELIPGPAPSLVVVRELVGELVMEMALALELEPELALVLELV